VPSPLISRRRLDSRRCRPLLPMLSSFMISPPSPLPPMQPNWISSTSDYPNPAGQCLLWAMAREGESGEKR
jgi:hypothetical protein